MYAIEMLNITKKFGDFYANKDITIQVKNNEIHALLGENGAGKSTLMSVLFGMYHQEAGVIKLNGKEVDIKAKVKTVVEDLKSGKATVAADAAGVADKANIDGEL